MDRAARIDAALARRDWTPLLRGRIERLLDGVDDRARLRCCGSGCTVCNDEVKRLLAEIDAAPAPA